MEPFKWPTFGFHQTNVGGEPRGGDRERNRSVFQRSKRIENIVETSVVMRDQIIRAG